MKYPLVSILSLVPELIIQSQSVHCLQLYTVADAEVLGSSPGVAATAKLCEADQRTVLNRTFPAEELEKCRLGISKVISSFSIIIPVL